MGARVIYSLVVLVVSVAIAAGWDALFGSDEESGPVALSTAPVAGGSLITPGNFDKALKTALREGGSRELSILTVEPDELVLEFMPSGGSRLTVRTNRELETRTARADGERIAGEDGFAASDIDIQAPARLVLAVSETHDEPVTRIGAARLVRINGELTWLMTVNGHEVIGDPAGNLE